MPMYASMVWLVIGSGLHLLKYDTVNTLLIDLLAMYESMVLFLNGWVGKKVTDVCEHGIISLNFR